jgi:flagellar biosynthetic protein FliQ
MEIQSAVDLGRGAITECLIIGGPLLLVLMGVGLLISVLQTVTNVHDYSVAFIPKLIAMVIALGIGLPWMVDKLADYSHAAFSRPGVTRLEQR